MNKRLIFRVVNLIAVVLAAILWVISAVDAEALGGFNFGWAAFIITGVWAISYTVRACTEKDVVMRKTWLILAVTFYITAAGSLIGALAMPSKLVLPIICLVAAVAVLIGTLVLGGKKWDEGDNEKPDYKNYYERKAEAEALKAAQAEEAKKTEETATQPTEENE